MFAGGTKGCAGNWLRLPCDGHRGRSRSGMEWSSIFGKTELQGTGGENSAGLWESHSTGTPKHCQIPQILDWHTQR